MPSAMPPKKDAGGRRASVVSRKSFTNKGKRGSILPPLPQTAESPSRQSGMESPSKQSVMESPTKLGPIESPTNEIPTAESPTKEAIKAQSPTKMNASVSVSSSRQPTQDKIEWLIEQMVKETQQETEMEPYWINGIMGLSRKPALPPIAPQPMVLEVAVTERLFQEAFDPDGHKPGEDELISQYQTHVTNRDTARQAIVLHQLGLLYLDAANARTPPVGQDYLQVNVVLNCAYSRCAYDGQKRLLIQKIQHVQRDYLSHCAGIQPKPFIRFYIEENDDEIDDRLPISAPGSRYRGWLADTRREATMFLSKFHSTWDRTFVESVNQPAEQKLAVMTEMQKSGSKLAADMKQILKVIFKDCEEKLGKAPCQYAVLGVGDLALDHITPYSDLEYVIVVSENSASHLKYFHHLCDLAALAITNIGETPLTHARIDLFQDFFNKHISQFADTVTPCGVKLNQHKRSPSMTPYCLHSYKEMESSATYGIDLIKLPKEMAKMISLLQRRGLVHMALKLYQVCFVHGSQDVHKAYEDAVVDLFSAVNLFEEDKPRELGQRLAADLQNRISCDPSEDVHPYYVNIQLEDLMQEIDAVKTLEYVLRLVYRCPLKSVHAFLDELKTKNVLKDSETCENFRFLLGISYVLKLSHSMHHASHHRVTNMLQGMQLASDLGEAMFGWNVDNMLEHFYTVYTPLWKHIEQFCTTNTDSVNITLHDSSVHVTSKAYYRLNKVQQSIEHMKGVLAALKKSPPKDTYKLWKTYTDLGHIALIANNVQLSKAFFTRAMESKEKITDSGQQFTAFVNTWCNFGLASLMNNDFAKSQTYFEESLSMVQDNNAAFLHTDAGKTFQYKVHSGLARCHRSNAAFKEALAHFQQALVFLESGDRRHKLRLQRLLLMEIGHGQLLLTQHKECHATLRKLYALSTGSSSTDHRQQELVPSMTMAITLRLLSQLMEHMGKMKQAHQYGSASYDQACSILDAKSSWLEEPPRLNHPDSSTMVLACREYAMCAAAGEEYPAAIRAMELVMSALHKPAAASMQHVTDSRTLGQFYLKHNQALNAYNCFQKCLELLLKIFGKKQNLHLVSTHCQIGCSLNALGKYENALDSFSVALLQADVCLREGKTHEVLANIYEQMAEANHHLQRYDKATVLFEDCIAIRKKLYGDTHPVIAESLKNQGLIFYKINEPEKAVHYLEQSVKMTQMINGHKAKSAELAKLLTIIGIVHEKIKQFAKGEESLQRALGMYEDIFQNSACEEIVDVLQRLGHMYRRMNDVYKAIKTHKQCLEMMRRLHGTENLKVSRLLAVIASHYQCNQLYSDTITIYENAIEIYRRVYGSDRSQEVGDWLINLAKCYEVIGEKEKASECHSRALEINQSSSGQDIAAREVYLSLKTLAETAESKGLTDQALMLHKQALEQCYQMYGSNKAHPDTVSALESVAKDYLQLSMHDEALDYNAALVKMLQNLYTKDKDQPQTAEALTRAGVICEAVGRTTDAIGHYTDALTMFRTIHKGDHVKIASCRGKLGHALDLSGQGQEAVEHLKGALTMLQNLKMHKGPKMELFCHTLYHLGLALETHPNFQEALAVHEKAFDAWKEFLTLEDEKKTSRIPQNVHLANSYQAIGRVHIALGSHGEGIKFLLNHVEMRDKLHGKKKVSMEYARYYTELGLAYRAADNMEQAVVELSNAVRIMKQLFGESRPQLHVAKCGGYLATCYGHLQLRSKAMETAKEAVSLYEKVLSLDSTEHAVYVELVSFLGDLYLEAEKPRTALRHYQKTFQYYMNIHGDNSFAEDVNTAMRKVMRAKAAIEQAKEAKKAAEEERINKRKARMETKAAEMAAR